MIVDGYTPDKVSGKIKKIGIEELDDKLQDDITLKNPVILMFCVIKDSDKFHSKLFLEEVL